MEEQLGASLKVKVHWHRIKTFLLHRADYSTAFYLFFGWWTLYKRVFQMVLSTHLRMLHHSILGLPDGS